MQHGIDKANTPQEEQDCAESKTQKSKGPLSVRAFNTCTRRYEPVEVTKAVYDAFRRTGWNIEDNDESFYEHEIQFTSLKNGESASVEFFHEFLVPEADPAVQIEADVEKELLHQAISQLPEMEQQLIQALYFKGLSNTAYAKKLGLSGQRVGQIRDEILKKLQRKLKKYFQK